MDPVSALAITSSCMTIGMKSGTLIMRITVFVSEVRSARKDLDAVSRELTSLQLCLSALKDDQQFGSLNLPETMKIHISQILVNIDLTLNQISDVLIKLSSGKLGRRIQWATTQRDEMNKFRSSLESNKAALEIALTIGSISMLTQQAQSSTRQDSRVETLLQRTESISLNTRTIDGKLDFLTGMHKDNTRFDKVAQEIESLRTHMTSLANASSNTSLDNFRMNSEAYTQSLLQTLQVTISDSRVAALSDQLSWSTSSPSQVVSCSCEDIYKARQQESEARFERHLAETKSRHTEKLEEMRFDYTSRLAEYEDLHANNPKTLQARENTIASLQQIVQQEVAENVRLKTEITTMKRQIEENAQIITTLRTFSEERENTVGNQVQEHSLRLSQSKRGSGKVDVLKDLPVVLKKEQLYRQLDGHDNWVMGVGFSPDGTAIVSGSYDKSVRIWDVATGKQLLRFDVGSSVKSVAFSPNNTIVAAELYYGLGVMLWTIRTGTCLRELNHSEIKSPSLGGDVSFSPDGTIVVSSELTMWRVATGKQIRDLKGLDDSLRYYSVCFSPDGTLIAAGFRDGSVRIWSVATGRQLRQLKAHTGPVDSLAFSPNGTTILSTTAHKLEPKGNLMKIWNAVTGTLSRQFETDQYFSVVRGIYSAAFSPDGTTIVSSQADYSVRIWDTSTGRHLRELGRHKDTVLKVAFSPDGNTVVSGSYDKSIRIWDVTT